MDHVQKMYMVPQHQLDILKNTQQPSPSTSIRQQAENDLDREMENVLNSSDTDVYIKAKQYSAVLQRYLAMVKQKANEKAMLTLTLPPGDAPPGNNAIENSIAAHDESEDAALSEIMRYMPGKHKDNAQHILDMMSKSRSVVSWTPQGEIIINGDPVRGTHLFDLLKSVTAPYRIVEDRRPHGWGPFLKTLADLNIPLSWIPNTAVKQSIIAIKRGGRGIASEKSDMSTPPDRGYVGRTPVRRSPPTTPPDRGYRGRTPVRRPPPSTPHDRGYRDRTPVRRTPPTPDAWVSI